MLRAAVLLVLGAVVAQPEMTRFDFTTNRYFYAARLIGALLLATIVPLLIDRRARHSSRAPH
jgi:hypothetical protein